MERRLLTSWRICLLAVFSLSVLLYLPSLMGGAIWDDTELISGSGFGENTFQSAFTHPFLKIYFRPLTSASFVLDSSFAKSTPFFYHQTNILLHAFTALLIACLTLLITKRQIAGLLAGLFFAIQPVQVDATAWIGGRTDVLSSLFITAFMVSLVLYHQSNKKGWLICSVLTFFLGAITKEQAIAIFPAVPVSVFVFGSKKWKDAWRLCIPFGATVLLFIGMWAINAPPPSGALNAPLETITVALRTTALYGSSFFVPHDRSLVSWTLENYKGPLWITAGLLFAVAGAYLFFITWKKNRALGWLALCGLLVYIPVSNFPSVPTLTVAPYRCAESGTAVACLLGAGLAWAVVNKKYLAAVPFALNLVAGFFVTTWGISVWSSEFNFFEHAAQADPHFIAGVTHYAEGLNGQNRWKESIGWSNELLTWLFGTEKWQALIEQKREGALTSYVKEKVHTNSGKPDVRTLGYVVSLVGNSRASMNQKGQAIQLYKDALAISPIDPRINFAYGKLVVGIDRKDAIRHWELALRVSPRFPVCAAALAHERVVDGNFRDAIRLLDPSLATIGWNSDAWIDFADAKIGLKDYKGASAALDSAEKAILVAKPKIEARRKLILELESPKEKT